MVLKELEKYLIPDLSNLVYEWLNTRFMEDIRKKFDKMPYHDFDNDTDWQELIYNDYFRASNTIYQLNMLSKFKPKEIKKKVITHVQKDGKNDGGLFIKYDENKKEYILKFINKGFIWFHNIVIKHPSSQTLEWNGVKKEDINMPITIPSKYHHYWDDLSLRIKVEEPSFQTPKGRAPLVAERFFASPSDASPSDASPSDASPSDFVIEYDLIGTEYLHTSGTIIIDTDLNIVYGGWVIGELTNEAILN